MELHSNQGGLRCENQPDNLNFSTFNPAQMKISTQESATTNRKSLKNYVFMILIFFLSGLQVSDAQAIYIDITPDTTISAIGGYYYLDLNNDGINDFKIIRIGINDYNDVSISCVHDSSFVSCYSLDACFYAKAYTLDQTIGNSEPWCPGNSSVNLANYGGITTCMHSGAFPGQTDKYLGLKLVKNGMSFYGWVRIDVGGDASWFTLKDYAYQVDGIVITDNPTVMPESPVTAEPMTIYPNPAKMSFTIETPNMEGDNHISILNQIGGHVVERQLKEKITRIDISSLPKGVYFVSYSKNAKRVKVSKLLKE
jgi:hypothetical protein